MLTFKEHSIKRNTRSVLDSNTSSYVIPSDLTEVSNNIQCASFRSRIKEKAMLEITVTKGFELIITLNNHSFFV